MCFAQKEGHQNKFSRAKRKKKVTHQALAFSAKYDIIETGTLTVWCVYVGFVFSLERGDHMNNLKFKKTIALILAIILTITLGITVYAHDWPDDIDDWDDDDWKAWAEFCDKHFDWDWDWDDDDWDDYWDDYWDRFGIIIIETIMTMTNRIITAMSSTNVATLSTIMATTVITTMPTIIAIILMNVATLFITIITIILLPAPTTTATIAIPKVTAMATTEHTIIPPTIITEAC